MNNIKFLIPSFLRPSIWRIYCKLKTFNFSGKYKCSICETRFDDYIAIGSIANGLFLNDIYVENVKHSVDNYETLNLDTFMCPTCGALDKTRLIYLFVQQKLKQRNNTKILHFAPEGGLSNILKYKSNVNYYSADLYRKDVMLNLDVQNMNTLDDESFDSFIFSHILEHVKDDDLALRELYRILNYGGWGIIMVPILLSISNTYEDNNILTPELRLKHFGLEDHLRVYSKNGFLEKLKNVGFTVKELSIDNFSSKEFSENGLSPKNILYVVEK